MSDFQAVAKHSEELDSTAVAMRQSYFGGGESSIKNLPVEAVFFWRKVARVQKYSGCSPDTYLQVQLDFFAEHDVDPASPEAVEALVSEHAFKRARAKASGHGSKDDVGLGKVTEAQAEHARKLYESFKKTYYPKDMRVQNPKSDVWKRIVLFAERSSEPLDKYVKASFIYSVNTRLKLPTPQLLASKDGLTRSLEINGTILEGPKK